jgi:hypothetical protein
LKGRTFKCVVLNHYFVIPSGLQRLCRDCGRNFAMEQRTEKFIKPAGQRRL